MVKIYAATYSLEDVIIGLEQFPLLLTFSTLDEFYYLLFCFYFYFIFLAQLCEYVQSIVMLLSKAVACSHDYVFPSSVNKTL